MIITVNKKTIPDVEFGTLTVPDYNLTGKDWQKVGETDTTITIEIMG